MLEVLTALASFLIVIRLGTVGNKMNGTTDHVLRAAYVLLIVGALGMALTPLYPWDKQWVEALFVFGVMAWVYAEKRRNWA